MYGVAHHKPASYALLLTAMLQHRLLLVLVLAFLLVCLEAEHWP